MAQNIRINGENLIFDKIVYLSMDGNDTTGSGDLLNPYKTLSRAIQDYSGFTAFKMADGVYDSVNINSRTYDDGIAFVGNGLNTRLRVTKTITVSNGVPDLYGDLYFYNLIWDGDNAGNGVNFIPLWKNQTTFNNVVFERIPNDAYSYFCADKTPKFHMNNCVKVNSSTNFLRNYNSPTQNLRLTNCYGAFTSGYGTKQSQWDYATNIITLNPQLDDEYNILEPGWQSTGTGQNPDHGKAHIGAYGGKFAWGWVVDKILLKSNNQIYTLSETSTLDNITSSIGDVENITQQEYEDYGFDGVSNITKLHLDELPHPVKLLVYRVKATNTTPPPRLRQEYSLNVGVRTMITKPL